MNFFFTHILSFNIFSPFLGIFIILFFYLFGRYNNKINLNVRQLSDCFGRIWPISIGIISGFIPFIISLLMIFEKSRNYIGFNLQEKFTLIKIIGLEYFIEVDDSSILMMLLSSFTIIICLIIFLQNKKYSSRHPVLGTIMLLILQVCCLGVFSSKDLLLFYIFFEASLIPMIFIIGIWGREDRVFAALKLFIYTIFGSLFFLFFIIYCKVFFESTDPDLIKGMISGIPIFWQKILFVCLFIAFAVKIPMIPFHTWLPDAHVQAPTFGSVALASVLIKMGGYAMIKFLIPIFPEEIIDFFAPFASFLSIIAIIYASLICIAQKDLKKLVAYSSVAHMGYVSLGIFNSCDLGYSGAFFQMISHGFISGALFFCVGIIYDKLHTLEISKIHSLASKMPFFSFMFMIFTLGSVGLPGTSGFIGEFLVIISSISSKFWLFGAFAALGVIFGAIYMLVLYKNMFFRHDNSMKTIGEDINTSSSLQISRSENIILCVFAALIIIYGIKPGLLLSKIENSKNVSYINCIEKKKNVN